MVALYHMPYKDSPAEYDDMVHIGSEIAAEIATTLDDADTALANADERLDRLPMPPGTWESRADLRAEITRARAMIEQVQRAVDPQSFYDEGRS